jgi:DNA-binding transcriptional MerR regulator
MTDQSVLEGEVKDPSITCKTCELAKVTGVKKQTLRRYARIGLLNQETNDRAVQRIYARDDLIRLERLIFMQMLGLSRSQIKQLLNQRSSLPSDLRLQRQILMEKRKRLNRLIYFIEYAEQINRDPDSEDWHCLGSLVEAINMLRAPEEFKGYYLHCWDTTDSTT